MVCSCGSRFNTAAHLKGLVPFQVSYCLSLEWFALPKMSHCCSKRFLHAVPDISLSLTWVTSHFRCSTATHLRWLWVVPGFSLPLPKVVLHHSKWPITTHWHGSVSVQFFDCQSLGLVCIVLLTRVPSHGWRCPSAAHWGDCAFFQIFYCWFLGWISVVPGVPCCFLGWLSVILPVSLPLTGMTCFISAVPLLLTGVAPCHLRFSSHSFLWLSFVSVVPHLLTGKGLFCYPICLTASHWSGSLLFQLLCYHWLWWFCFT